MATVEQLLVALQKADEAGDTEAAKKIALAIQAVSQQGQGQPELADRGTGHAIATGLGQGATLGFSDEIMSGLRAGLGTFGEGTLSDFGERYGGHLGEAREGIAAAREHHPWATGISEFVPGLAFGGAGVARGIGGAATRAGMQAAGKQGLRANLGKLAGTGAGYGGVAGAGYSEADTLGGVAGDAATGAAFGAGLGVGLPLVGSGIKRGAQNLGRRFGAQGGGAKGAAEEAARRQIIKDLKRDGFTPDEAAQVLARNEHYYLADVGPKNMGDLVEDIAQNPGSGRLRMDESLTNRGVGAIDRIRPALREGIEQSPLTSKGLKIPGEYDEIERAIMEHAEQLAKPLWKTAFASNVQFKATPWMKGLVKRNKKGLIKDPLVRSAHKKAVQQIRNRVTGGEITEAEAMYHSRYFDELQRALSDKTTRASVKGATGEATTRGFVHRKLLKELKKPGVMHKDWKTARKLWAGKQANKEALKEGEKIFAGHIGKHKAKLSKMAKSERDHYLVGALRAIEDRIMRKADTGDLLRELRATNRGKEVIKLLFGGEKGFQRFKQVATQEEKMAGTLSRFQKGSATYGRSVKGQDVGGAVGTLGGILLATNLGIPGLPLLARFGGRKAAKALQNANELKRNAMADLLLTRNPEQLNQSLQRPLLPLSPMLGTLGLGGAATMPGLLDQ
jgi:hypothetical protein